MADPVFDLKRRVESHEAVIGIVGLGYVGLPLAVEFAKVGLKTLGVDVDPRKAESLNAGTSYIQDVPSSAVDEAVKAGRFSATTDFDSLAEADVIFICVPTPITSSKEPDMTFVRSASEAVAARLRRGQLIV
ncbi:MAG: NAD(P)-binding domain-containing protein, partial [Rhodothermales bacterium]|nr:NAD(P)-binding domain-containing protein [Rhodothermales bacterium]